MRARIRCWLRKLLADARPEEAYAESKARAANGPSTYY